MIWKVWVSDKGWVLKTSKKRLANNEAREWRRQGFIALVRFTREIVVR